MADEPKLTPLEKMVGKIVNWDAFWTAVDEELPVEMGKLLRERFRPNGQEAAPMVAIANCRNVMQRTVRDELHRIAFRLKGWPSARWRMWALGYTQEQYDAYVAEQGGRAADEPVATLERGRKRVARLLKKGMPFTYFHRNGEQTLPVVEGFYWLEDTEHTITIALVEASGDAYLIAQHGRFRPESFLGCRWYGPLPQPLPVKLPHPLEKRVSRRTLQIRADAIRYAQGK